MMTDDDDGFTDERRRRRYWVRLVRELCPMKLGLEGKSTEEGAQASGTEKMLVVSGWTVQWAVCVCGEDEVAVVLR